MNTAAKLNVQGEQSSSTQKSKQTFPNRCLEKGNNLYLDSNSADVYFLFGSTDKTASFVPAHKAILAGNSDVFGAMFYGKMKETGDVHVPDATDAAFMEFLQYFYLAEVTLTAKNIVGVLDLGTKYDVEKCVNDCVQFLIRTLDDDNVCAHLDLAILYEKKELLVVCEKRVLTNTAAVFNSDGFRKCTKRSLAHIVKMDVLSCTEMDIFAACMEWVKAKSGRAELTIGLVEQYLGDSYYDIRLPSLTIQQFCELHTQFASVLERDYVTITKMIALPDYQVAKFNKNQRNAVWNASASITCDRTPSSRSNTQNSSYDDSDTEDYDDDDHTTLDVHEETIFSVSEPILLGSLMCAQIFDEGYAVDLQAKLEISEAVNLDGADSKVLSTTEIQFETDDETDVLLPHPVLIRPGFFYTIRIGPFPPAHYYYSKLLDPKVKLESEIEVDFHMYISRSLIRQLKFNRI